MMIFFSLYHCNMGRFCLFNLFWVMSQKAIKKSVQRNVGIHTPGDLPKDVNLVRDLDLVN